MHCFFGLVGVLHRVLEKEGNHPALEVEVAVEVL